MELLFFNTGRRVCDQFFLVVEMLGLGSALPQGREHDFWELLAWWGWWVRLLWGLGGPGLVWMAVQGCP